MAAYCAGLEVLIFMSFLPAYASGNTSKAKQAPSMFHPPSWKTCHGCVCSIVESGGSRVLSKKGLCF